MIQFNGHLQNSRSLRHSLLHSAAKGGRWELCAYLLLLGGDPGAADDEGLTPVDLAKEAGASRACSGWSLVWLERFG